MKKVLFYTLLLFFILQGKESCPMNLDLRALPCNTSTTCDAPMLTESEFLIGQEEPSQFIGLLGSKIITNKINEQLPWWILSGATLYLYLIKTEDFQSQLLPALSYGVSYALSERYSRDFTWHGRRYSRLTLLLTCMAIQAGPSNSLQSAALGTFTGLALHDAQNHVNKTTTYLKKQMASLQKDETKPTSNDNRLAQLHEKLDAALNPTHLIIKPGLTLVALIAGGGTLISCCDFNTLVQTSTLLSQHALPQLSDFSARMVSSSLIYEQAYRTTKKLFC